MLQFGKNIQNSVGDVLTKISIEQLYEMIAKPDIELKNMIRRLRILRNIDAKKYKESKVLLPYFTTGIFNPPIRKTENFASSEYFVIDLDHFSESDTDMNSLRLELAQDNRVMMLFISPGNDGLKLVFKFSQKCFDAAKYQMFYKLFAQKFNQQYNLNQVIDVKTSDVSRATFISWDSDAYFNAQALTIDINKYINFDSSDEVYEAELLISEIDKSAKSSTEIVKEELAPDILQQIKQQLKPSTTKKKEKFYFVPEEVDRIMDELVDFLEKFQLKVAEISDISFGRKFKIEVDLRWCEINLFYGKKGFSVTKTPKTGSNDELAEVALKLFYSFINTIVR